MSEPAYGTLKKKIVFYDSEKRHADFKIRLKVDGISQAQFFRSIVTGYLEQNESILDFIDKFADRERIYKTILENKLEGLFSDLGWVLNTNQQLFNFFSYEQ